MHNRGVLEDPGNLLGFLCGALFRILRLRAGHLPEL
jgi:hypothetical protein